MRKLINYKVVTHTVGSLLIICGLLMFTAIPFSIFFGEGGLLPMAISGAVTTLVGFLAWVFTRNASDDEIRKRDGYLTVTLGWLFMALFGTLPYVLSGAIPDYTNAFFETMSGLTTTGASILNDIESLPKGILFWRSMTQWIGGMGIIVLTIAILPLLGIGGMELFIAEAPGPTKDKIHPRIKETAKRLWVIYVALTVLQTILLWVAGMTFYDAINHALTTMSTGGFSTKQASVGHFDSAWIHYIIIVFMFLAGTNFTMLYFGFKGRLDILKRNDEFKWYVLTVLFLLTIVSASVYQISDLPVEEAFRSALFQVVSILTTTGYATADFTSWGTFMTLVFFVLIFLGASAGSTSGGFKLVRIVLLMKNGFSEFKRRLHPKAIIPVRMNGEAVSSQQIYNLLAFLLLYIFIFVVGSILMAAQGVGFEESISSVATSLSNVGPGIGSIGPSHSFYELPALGKWILAFLMLVGRLEIFTVLIIFTPYFWRRN